MLERLSNMADLQEMDRKHESKQLLTSLKANKPPLVPQYNRDFNSFCKNNLGTSIPEIPSKSKETAQRPSLLPTQRTDGRAPPHLTSNSRCFSMSVIPPVSEPVAAPVMETFEPLYSSLNIPEESAQLFAKIRTEMVGDGILVDGPSGQRHNVGKTLKHG